MLDQGQVVPGSMEYGALVQTALGGLSAETSAVNPDITTLGEVTTFRRLARRDMSSNFPPATVVSPQVAGNDMILVLAAVEAAYGSSGKQWVSRKRMRHDALLLAREGNLPTV